MSLAKKPSTALSHEAEVGVKWKVTGVVGEPCPHLRVFVGGVVVDDRMDQLAGRYLGLDGVEESDELLMAMALHVAADDVAFEDIEGGEQGCGAVAFVVVGHGAGASLLHGQSRLGAVEGLNLALLVDREDDGMSGRVDIEADNVPELVGELRVLRQLEGADAVRGELMGLENALDRAQADTYRLGQHPPGPVRGLTGRRRKRQIDNALHDLRRQRRLARLARLVAKQPSTPSCMKRSCQRQTTGLERPERRMISKVPQPSAVARMMLARHTCFCGALRSETIASSRRRSSSVTLTTIPALMPRA